MSKPTSTNLTPVHEEIATYAYYLWEAEGRQAGRDQDYWFQAEAQLSAHRRFEAGLLKEAPARREGKSTGRIAADARPQKLQIRPEAAAPQVQFA